jgi:hypothetical protein
MRIRGTERLASVATTGAVAAGTVLYASYLNPKAFGVRLVKFADTMAKFRFRNVRIHYVPAISPANALATGMLYLALDVDPNSDLGLTLLGQDVAAIATWEGNVIEVPVYAPAVLNCTLDESMQMPLFVDSQGDNRFSAQGIMQVVAGNAFTAAATFGQLFIEYEIELDEPNTQSGIVDLLIGFGDAVTSGTYMTSNVSTSIDNWQGDTSLLSIDSTSTWIVKGTQSSTQGISYRLTLTGYANTAAATLSAFPQIVFLTGTLSDGNSPYGLLNPNSPNTGTTRTAGGISANTIWNGTAQTLNSMLMMDWYFTVNSDTASFIISAPTYSAGSAQVSLVLNVLSRNGFAPVRTSPNAALLGVQQQSAVDRYNAECPYAMRIAILNAVADARNSPSSTENDNLNILIECFNLPTTKLPSTPSTSALFVVPVLVWLAQKFGPLVAAHMLGMAEKKLKEYLKNQK